MNIMLLMMGGKGTRFGATTPKQYTIIDGKPLFSYIVEKMNSIEVIDKLIVVSHSEWIEYVDEWCNKITDRLDYEVVSGGDNRSQSVKNGLQCAKKYASDNDVVMISDATHPYVDGQGIEKIIEAVKEYGGATLASKNYDTVYRVDSEGLLEKIEPREFIVAGASPEAFRFGLIYKVYQESSDDELAKMTSAGAIALSHNIPMKVIPTDILNLKITYTEDMKLFLQLKDNYYF